MQAREGGIYLDGGRGVCWKQGGGFLLAWGGGPLVGEGRNNQEGDFSHEFRPPQAAGQGLAAAPPAGGPQDHLSQPLLQQETPPEHPGDMLQKKMKNLVKLSSPRNFILFSTFIIISLQPLSRLLTAPPDTKLASAHATRSARVLSPSSSSRMCSERRWRMAQL